MKYVSIFLAVLLSGTAMAADGRNDVKAPVQGEDSVHVAICTGTDINKSEILLVDRLCLNRDAVGVVKGSIDQLQGERNKLLVEINKANKAKADLEAEQNKLIVVSALGGAGAAAIVITAVLVGLKASGNLK